MLRECSKIDLSPFIAEFRIKNVFSILLYYDEENQKEILDHISRNIDRFRRAVYVILQGRYNNDLYGKEKVSAATINITAIKFKKRKNANYRIYCKEFPDEVFPNRKKIVMVAVYNKKSQKNDKRIKTLIQKIARYEYKFEG